MAYLVPYSVLSAGVSTSLPRASSKKLCGSEVSTRVIEFALTSPDRYLIFFLVTLTLSPEEESRRPPGFEELTTKGTSQELPACKV